MRHGRYKKWMQECPVSCLDFGEGYEHDNINNRIKNLQITKYAYGNHTDELLVIIPFDMLMELKLDWNMEEKDV